ncbi:MAG: hypothetical protein KF687_16305 [Cyclobacteriaceae bacterium]|nr:hypothetical protein [Cyclobacteriaceae bacterium]
MYISKFKTAISLTILILHSIAGKTQRAALQEYYNKAKEAYQQKNYPTFYDHISKALEIHPYHQGIMYQKALAAAHNQKPDEAVALLQSAILISTTFDLTVDDLKSLQNREDFKSVIALKERLGQPITNSVEAFTIPDPQLHAENITPGFKSGTFFVSSIHKRKVVYIDVLGNSTDFISSKQNGLGAVMCVKADSKTNSLWVASTVTPEMMEYDSTLTSAIYQFDARTKKMIACYEVDIEAKGFFFGDIVLNKAGEVFVSDSQNNVIFKINIQTKKLESYFTSDEFWNIQGISFSVDEKYLYIADYIKGIFRLTLSTKELIQLPVDAVASVKGVDGLIVYQNSLIVIQNGVQPMRVMQLPLNESGDGIISARTIDHKHPDFNEPTNGCLVNDTLYYVANSQWSGYDAHKKIKPASELKSIIILKSPLKP